MNNYVNECSMWSSFEVKVAWLQSSDVMLPLAKNMYLIGLTLEWLDWKKIGRLNENNICVYTCVCAVVWPARHMIR